MRPAGITDLRRGIDALTAMGMQQYGKELVEESLFLFPDAGQTGSRHCIFPVMGTFCCTSG